MHKLRPILISSWQSILTKRNVTCTAYRSIKTTPSLSNTKDEDHEPDPKNPIRRTLGILKQDVKNFAKKFTIEKSDDPQTEDTEVSRGYVSQLTESPSEGFQTHCDILIIGGGGVGSSIAYWLKKKAREGLNVVLVEQESTYTKGSVLQSFHGLNQHFSLPENIQLALHGADFMRDAKEQLGDINLNFMPYGSLILATEEDAELLKKNSRTQNEMGVRNELLSQEKLKEKFPWLNTDGIALGSHGLEREGWFDPLSLLLGYKNKAREFGTHFVEGEVVDFEYKLQSDVLVDGETCQNYYALDKAVVQLADGEKRVVKFALCIIAAGSSSAKVGRLAKIGCGPGLLSIPLPVKESKRYAYIFNSPKNLPAFSTPLTVDPSGTYFRREGLTGNYLCSRNSSYSTTNDQTEEQVFENEIRPALANRVPAFQSVKVEQSWSGTCEQNTFDDNGVLGAHPYYNNLYIAAGFDGHGMQQTFALGRGMCELIIDGRFRSIDLTRLGFDRLVVNQPMYEDFCF